MNIIEITKAEAKRFLIHYHGLDSTNSYLGKKGILEYVEKVGCIQYDPLNVVGRNPDLVLQSRIDGYQPSMLKELLYEERSLVDGWDKMMAIYHLKDWQNFNRLRIRKEQETKAVLKNRGLLDALQVTKNVTELIRQKGPLLASEINIGKGRKGRWGTSKLSSAALDYLFSKGELGIHSKKNTHKRYDFIENLLPHDLLNTPDLFSNDREFYKWYVKRRVGSVGLLWGKSGGGWLGHFISNKKLRLSLLKELVEEEELVRVAVEGNTETYYIRKEDMSVFQSMNIMRSSEVRFIAPLDNLLWDRAMIEELFGFKYRWEVYTPKTKRKYGYYVLPVLYGDNFIARFEPEKQRETEPLEIKNWWWEEKNILTKEIETAIYKGFESFCEYLKADGIHESSLNRLLK